MVLTDPRSTLQDWFNPGVSNEVIPGNLLLDDDATLARYEAAYEMSEERLLNKFHEHNIDVIFVIKRLAVEPMATPSGPIGYRHICAVQPAVIDKYDGSGDTILTATVLADQASQEIRRVLRTNMSGSMRLSERERSEYIHLGSTIIWGDEVTVFYYQYVTSYADTTNLVTLRRFFNHIHELRIGTASDAYSKVGESSGIGPVWWQPITGPVENIEIPKAYFGVTQIMGNYNLELFITIHDYETVTNLFRTIDVVAGGATETAVGWDSTPHRNPIGYLAFVVNNTEVNNTTDARAAETSTFSFQGHVYVDVIKPMFDMVAGPWVVRITADYLTQTDA